MFYVLTFAASWVLWLPLLGWLRAHRRLGADAGDEPLRGIPWWVAATWFAGASAPSIVGVLLTARSGGWDGVDDLLGRLLDVDLGVGWLALAVAVPLAAGLVAVAAHWASGGGGVQVQPRRVPLVPVALVAALPFGPLGEELGWRGYALPRLLDDHGALLSAMVIGVVWAAWHLPLFWAPLGTSVSGRRVTVPAVARFATEILATSVVMTWLFVHTNGSLSIAVGFHASWNAGMHRFFFAPLPDDAADRVETLAVAGFILAALVLALWPGLSWRA